MKVPITIEGSNEKKYLIILRIYWNLEETPTSSALTSKRRAATSGLVASGMAGGYSLQSK